MAVRELKDMTAEAGRDPDALRVQIHSTQSDVAAHYSIEERRGHLGELARPGVTDFVVRVPAWSLAQSIDALRGYASDVAAL
jgi:hypothetical protein